MRIITLFFIIIFLGTAAPSFGQAQPTKKDNFSALLQEIFIKVKQNSLFRASVNWDSLSRKVIDNSGHAITETEFKDKIRLIFETIGDKHGGFYYQEKKLGMDRAWIKNLRVPENWPDTVKLKAQLLEEGYGYIILPPTTKHDNQTCQRYQESLCSLGIENLKGLVIDLRLHQGGSNYPLFVGLNQLYGAKYFGSSAGINGNLYQKWTVDNGRYGSAQVTNHCKVNTKLKIVVLISQITASAGEMMAVGLKGRPNTIFIGEPTLGLTTMNAEFTLGTGMLGIATSMIADRNGNVYRNNVLPDVTIVKGDNFKDLSKDTKVIAALKWMKN